MRSVVSVSDVYRSRGNPQNSDPVDLSTTRPVSPDTTQAEPPSIVTSVVRAPPPAQRELLDLAHPVLLGEGVDGVLLRISGDDLGVVADQVRVGEVATQRARHVQVLDLVPVAVPGDVDQADLRLAVLIVAEGDGHDELHDLS